MNWCKGIPGLQVKSDYALAETLCKYTMKQHQYARVQSAVLTMERNVYGVCSVRDARVRGGIHTRSAEEPHEYARM